MTQERVSLAADKEKRIRLRKQTDEWLPIVQPLGIKVTCGNCSRKINFWYMVRCLYCGFFFCRQCAEEHFKSKGTD